MASRYAGKKFPDGQRVVTFQEHDPSTRGS